MSTRKVAIAPQDLIWINAPVTRTPDKGKCHPPNTVAEGGSGHQTRRYDVDSRQGIIAIVDDDPAVLDSLKFLLEVAGYRVATYPSAARYLADEKVRPSCLILDQHMPEMTGLELAAHLRTDGLTTPVLLITGSPSHAIVARAAQIGIEKVLEKPPEEGDLLHFVEAPC
jgi:two-component system, LuxR family, response regulator FixJ